MEYSSLLGFKTYNHPFCLKGAELLVSLKFPLVEKTITQRKTRRNPLYPSSYKLSCLFFLLHNLMSKDLFGEAWKSRNNEQEDKRKSNRKENGRESLMSSFKLLKFFWLPRETTLEKGLGYAPPLFIFP